RDGSVLLGIEKRRHVGPPGAAAGADADSEQAWARCAAGASQRQRMLLAVVAPPRALGIALEHEPVADDAAELAGLDHADAARLDPALGEPAGKLLLVAVALAVAVEDP